ncbi:MAG: hypothetical protein KDA41_15370, partial [Planctomycetales bacterium]|nr:hypothetical protein [Planctomycetales bacterium]
MRQVEQALAGFSHRRDFLRTVESLADTGVAGASINFSFFAATALWLASRWPDRLQIDWDSFENADALERYLPLLISNAEAAALDSYDLGLSAWI